MALPPRFFVFPGDIREGLLELPSDEARHAANSLRLKPGDPIELFDGEGVVGAANIIEVSKDNVTVAIESRREEDPFPPKLILATAIPKGKRWQMLVEKCTELGVAEIQPVIFQYSVAEGQGDPDKWRRWAIEACKQCRRALVPVIRKPLKLRDFLQSLVEGPCLFGALDGDPLIKWGGQIDRASEVAIVIGPEAGMTKEEEGMCYAASYAPVLFSHNILRIETACMAACTLVRGLL
ncbi:MAG: 16S rRNA (uracil(1498)-N(3))-methyltransferase [Planctomycetes bacterium]|nr:16S rRNA (uracil(1498)-N(3))-methyltransferase [Planctomycetota bacterium]